MESTKDVAAEKLISQKVKTCLISNESEKRGADTDAVLEVFRSAQPNTDTYTYWAQAGQAVIPLSVHVPVLRVTDGSWILPLPSGFQLGVVFPKDSNGVCTVDDEFEKLVAHIALYQDLEAPDANGAIVSALGTAGAGIEKGGEMAAAGLKKGASEAGKGMHKMSAFAMKKLKPRAKEVEISDSTKYKIKVTKQASGTACKVSAGLVMGVAAMAATLGHIAADEIDKQLEGTKWGKKLHGKSGPKTAAAKDVVKQSFNAYVIVFTALEEASWVMLSEAASSTSDVVEHRYGKDAGEASKDVFAIAGNTGKTAYYAKSLGTKAVIKAAVKTTAKDLVSSKDEREANKKDSKSTTTAAAVHILTAD